MRDKPVSVACASSTSRHLFELAQSAAANTSAEINRDRWIDRERRTGAFLYSHHAAPPENTSHARPISESCDHRACRPTVISELESSMRNDGPILPAVAAAWAHFSPGFPQTTTIEIPDVMVTRSPVPAMKQEHQPEGDQPPSCVICKSVPR